MREVVARNESRLLKRLRELVEVESPSEDKAAVDRAGALVAGWVAEMGGVVKRHRQKGFGDVLELRFGSSRSRTGRVLLLGHLDTVWPMGTLAKMPWREADGKDGIRRIWGPGVLDMKAGVVMALEAIAAAKSLGAERPVTLLLVSEEEVGSPVSRAITEKVARECEAVFVLEPAQGLAYKTARKGVGHFELRVEGVASHAGVDFERGHSAVLEMARLVETVSGFTDLKRGLTVNVGVIAGGTRSNVIAAECRCEVDVRIAKATDAARVARMFRGLKVTDKACRLTVSGGINRPPMERKAGTVALFKQARKLAAEMGLMLEEASTGGGSDGNFTAGIGVATLDGMGAVGAGAHADHEHVVVKHLVERTAMIAGMIAFPSPAR
ncbi:M20/M25/M40 family metallo-hydrolase [Granulicella sp. 5B5]|uniref:M20 family metallopeptidase n=1 Tax=Granulicella sp. 5B5 TaxID=1617967 RepID=UPI0015F62FFA|nr:M20 family metallopeptidase [Granulicella sp. 5B5]QMV18819.1 M20/M25/M40 family metallo-hydrolase [Granulicella sp. 5B5]